MSHQWYYNKPGLLDDETIGPVDQGDFLEQVRDGSIKPMWLVMSPTATSGAWHKMDQLPKLMEIRQKAIDQREAEASAQQESLRQQRAAEQALRQAEQAEAKQQADAAAEGKRRIREAEDRSHQEWLRRQPPEAPFPISVATALLALVAICTMCAGFVGFGNAKTVYHELLAMGCFVLTGLALIASLLDVLCRSVKWVGQMIKWKDERDDERGRRQ